MRPYPLNGLLQLLLLASCGLLVHAVDPDYYINKQLVLDRRQQLILNPFYASKSGFLTVFNIEQYAADKDSPDKMADRGVDQEDQEVLNYIAVLYQSIQAGEPDSELLSQLEMTATAIIQPESQADKQRREKGVYLKNSGENALVGLKATLALLGTETDPEKQTELQRQANLQLVLINNDANNFDSHYDDSLQDALAGMTNIEIETPKMILAGPDPKGTMSFGSSALNALKSFFQALLRVLGFGPSDPLKSLDDELSGSVSESIQDGCSRRRNHRMLLQGCTILNKEKETADLTGPAGSEEEVITGGDNSGEVNNGISSNNGADGISNGADMETGGIGDGAGIETGGIGNGAGIETGGIGNGAGIETSGIGNIAGIETSGIGNGAGIETGGIGNGAGIETGGIRAADVMEMGASGGFPAAGEAI